MRRPVRWRWWAMAAGIVGLGGLVLADWWSVEPETLVAGYVGASSCVKCHAQQFEEWRGSYHDLAMDLANGNTVLGDFDNAEIEHFGVTSRFFRRDGKYFVHTEGPTGELVDFEIKYVLGVSPLQQYMVEFERPAAAQPAEVARLQVLNICWDTLRRKWFALQPPDVNERVMPGDDLHWTGIAQRWNNMCADCHTTNYQKNFDVATRTYRSTFDEMDVSCEACHGPGSLHVKLAQAPSLFWDRRRGYGLAKLKDENSRVQIETCAPCHAMRRIVKPGYRGGEPFFDYFADELLLGHLYHADGQIMEEVYEYGSFTQSKMYHKGIRCTDCHNPHTTKVKYQGNRLCTSCHQHPAGKYDSPAHHHHDPSREGALCTSCHMPKTTYMAVDPRLDHSLRIPRPDVSVSVGTPNACTGCHLDKGGELPAQSRQFKEYSQWLRAARNGDEHVKQALARVDAWSAARFREWYGEKPDEPQHFSHALAAARRGEPAAESQLARLAQDHRLSGIVRATCLFELGQYSSEAVVDASRAVLTDDEPLVRLVAIANLERLPEEPLVKYVAPLLHDKHRAVRAEAGRVLARVDLRWLTGPQRTARDAALTEYQQGFLANNDRAAGHMGLGVLAEQRGDATTALRAYETALQIEPQVAGPRANLAALLERMAESTGDEVAARALAERVKQLRREELDLLARDSRLVPGNASLRYRYGLSLYLHDRMAEAEQELREAVRLAPNAPDLILGLTLLLQRQNKWEDARKQAQRLIELRPNDPSYRQLLEELQQPAAAESKP